AVLSPKRLGPAAQFAPVPVEASSEQPAARARVRATNRPAGIVVAKTWIASRAPLYATQSHRGKSHAAPARVARRHGNPLDAQASDTRIQVWPCRSGGICNWRR